MPSIWPSTALLLACLLAAGCAQPKYGYGVSAPAQAQLAAEADSAEPPQASLETLPTYLSLVRRMQGNGLWFASLAHLDALEKRWGASPDSRLLRADALRQTGQPREAEALYARLLGTPLEGAAQHGLGLLAASEGDLDRAIAALEKARAFSPTDALLLSDLGYAMLRAARPEAARLPLMQAVQMQPQNARVQGNLALYLLMTGQPKQAEALMKDRAMPPALQDSIRQQARQLRPLAHNPARDPARDPAAAPATAPAVALQLRPSAWAGDGADRAAPATPATAALQMARQ